MTQTDGVPDRTLFPFAVWAIGFALTLAGVLSPRAAACDPIIIDDQGGIPESWLASTVGGSSDSKNGGIPTEGMFWKVSKIQSGATSNASMFVKPGDGHINAMLWQQLRRSGSNSALSDGRVGLQLKLNGLSTNTATVRVTVTRYVEASASATGSIEFTGFGGGTFNLSNGSLKESSSTDYELAGNASVPFIDLRAEAELTGSGSPETYVNVQMAVDVEVFDEAGLPCTPVEETIPDDDVPPVFPEPDPPTDELLVCPPPVTGCGGLGTGGVGLHVELATGQVFTEVPIFETQATGETEFDLRFRYNTINRNSYAPAGETPIAGPAGNGWRHSFQKGLFIKLNWDDYVLNQNMQNDHRWAVSHIVYYDEGGRANKLDASGTYRWDVFPTNSIVSFSLSSSAPRGRDMKVSGVLESGGPQVRLDLGNGTIQHYEVFVEDPPQPENPIYLKTRIVREVDRRGRTTYYQYDSSAYGGRLQHVISPHGRRATFAYDANGKLDSITHPNGQVTDVLVAANGTLTSITDPDNKTQSFEYDTSYRVTKETLKNGRFLTADYSGFPQRVELKDQNGASIARLEATGAAELRDDRSDDLEAGWLTYFDGKGQPWQIFRDKQGRLLRKMAPSGETRIWNYGGPDAGNNRNRVVSVVNERGVTETSQNWGANGRLASRYDAEGNQTNYEYSTGNFPYQLISRSVPGTSQTASWVYTYSPDGKGDLSTIADPVSYNNDTVLTYVTWSATEDVPSYVPSGGLPGRIKTITRTDRNGNVTQFNYDGRGNLTSVVRDQGTGGLALTTNFDYDVTSSTNQDDRGMGRVVRRTVVNPSGHTPATFVTEMAYDAMGRVTSVKEGPSTAQLTTTVTYDGHGLMTSVTDPENRVTELVYDVRNRLEWQKVDPAGLNLRTKFEYDLNDNVVKRYDPKHFANGNSGYVTDYNYNELNQLVTVTDPADDNNVRHVTTFERDGVGNATLLRRTNAHGASNTSVYEVEMAYDPLNRLIERIVNPNGTNPETTTLSYGATGCSCSGPVLGTAQPQKIVVDSNEGTPNKDKITYFRYDVLNRRTAIVRKVGGDTGGSTADTDDAEVRFTYDAEGNLTQVEGAENELITFGYDGANRREWAKAWFGTGGSDYLETIFAYDGDDNVVGVETANGNELRMVYDAYGRLQKAEDRKLDSSDAFSVITQFTYEDNGNVLTRSTAISGQTWTYGYDNANRLTTITDPQSQVSTIAYDENGNRASVIDRRGIKTSYEYDQLNRLLAMIEDSGNTGSTTHTANTRTEFAYNSMRQTRIEDHDGNATHYEYDAALRLAKATYPDTDGVSDNDAVTYTYWLDGLLKTRTDQRGVVTTYGYNDLGQLASRQYAGGGFSTRTEYFTFDQSGRLTTADNGVAELDFVYGDRLGRLTSTAQKFLSTNTTYSTTLAYTVNATDVLRTITYPGTRQVQERRDRRGRLVGVGEFDSPTNQMDGVAFTYDAADRRIGAYMGENWQWNTGKSAPANLNDLIDSVFSYDLNNRLTSIQHANDVADLFKVGYGYDAEGNRLYTRNFLQTDRSETYQHDDRNRLTAMDRGLIDMNASPPAITTPINDAELPRSQSWPNGVSSGLDRRGNWSTFETDRNDTLKAETRQHDDANQLERTDFTIGEMIGNNGFDYDAAGNLIKVYIFGDMNCDGQTTVGDIGAFVLALTDPAAYATQYPTCFSQIGDVNNDGYLTLGDISAFVGLLTDGTPGLDAIEYVYDEENRLTQVKKYNSQTLLLEIAYDAIGRRVWTREHDNVEDPCADDDPKYPVETRHVVLGLTPIEEYQKADCPSPTPDVDWELAREFLWGDRFPEPLSMVDWTAAGDVAAGSPEKLYYLRDVLGSVVGLAKPEDQQSSGTQSQLVERYVYDPYGKTMIESWNAGTSQWVGVDQSEYGNPWMWTGQRYDAGVGLYHFMFRSYSPELGRWLQRDPLGYVSGTNLLQYVSSGAVSFNDPFGLYQDPDSDADANNAWNEGWSEGWDSWSVNFWHAMTFGLYFGDLQTEYSLPSHVPSAGTVGAASAQYLMGYGFGQILAAFRALTPAWQFGTAAQMGRAAGMYNHTTGMIWIRVGLGRLQRGITYYHEWIHHLLVTFGRPHWLYKNVRSWRVFEEFLAEFYGLLRGHLRVGGKINFRDFIREAWKRARRYSWLPEWPTERPRESSADDTCGQPILVW